MSKRLLAILLAAVMIIALSSACSQGGGQSAGSQGASAEQDPAGSSSDSGAAAEPEAKAPELPFVELNIYMMGEVGEDMDQFYEIFDEWTRRDLNCTVRFKHANTWIDYAAKYNLMLTADDTIDMCFAANWIDFYAYAKKDAFEDITDMLPAYAPKIWQNYPRERFNGATVNGKIYAVPQNWTNYHGENFVYREDLRKKYNLPEMAMDWNIIENYIKTVLENEDIPFAVTYQYTNPVNLFLTIDLSTKYDGLPREAVGMRSERGTKNTILYYEDPKYVDFAKRMKEWCDMGFWSKSILATADSTDHTDLFAEGLIFVVTNSHLDRLQGIPEKILKDGIDMEVGLVPHASVSGKFYHTHTAQDLTVIPNGSKNPERALMVLDKLIMDKEYYDLTQYGILGLNYELDENGSVSHINIDTTAHRFDLCLWAMRNEDLAYPVTRLWEGRTAYEKEHFPKLEYDPFDGFAVDLNDVQTEHTALTQVLTEYGDPIQWGLVADPVEAVETLKQRMKEAGIDRFKAEIDRQISEYFDSRN